MKKWLGLLALLPIAAEAGEFEPTLVAQTGKMVEGDLAIRNSTDLGANKTGLAFYVRTSGTSPVIQCYNASSGFGAQPTQVGHIKSEDLIVRKIVDHKNRRNCVAADVITPGTSPAVACYPYQYKVRGEISEADRTSSGKTGRLGPAGEGQRSRRRSTGMTGLACCQHNEVETMRACLKMSGRRVAAWLIGFAAAGVSLPVVAGMFDFMDPGE